MTKLLLTILFVILAVILAGQEITAQSEHLLEASLCCIPK